MRPKPVTFGDVPVHQRLATGQLARVVVAALAEELPVYRSLPAEELASDILHATERGIRLFVDVLRTGALPTAGELAALRESAARRAEEGVPLDAVLSAYHIGVRVCLDHVAPQAVPGDLTAVFDTQRLMLDYLRLVTAAVSGGYFDERQSMVGEEQQARQSLLSALLEGGDTARSGLRLPAGYLVLSIGVGTHPDERRDGVDGSVAGRRKLRRLRLALDRLAPEPVLSMLSLDGGIALLARPTVAEQSSKDWATLCGAVTELGRSAGAPVLAAAVPASPSGVPSAARLAGELRAVAVAFGRPPGLYRLDDLTLEYQLTRPGPARDRLAAQLDPVRGKPELLGTLRTYVDSGLNRRATASSLHVHPNTVDYRLRKLAALTGLDTTQPAQLPRIRAALAAVDAAEYGVG